MTTPHSEGSFTAMIPLHPSLSLIQLLQDKDYVLLVLHIFTDSYLRTNTSIIKRMLAALVEGPFESPERTVFHQTSKNACDICDHFRNGQHFFSFWVFFSAYNPATKHSMLSKQQSETWSLHSVNWVHLFTRW